MTACPLRVADMPTCATATYSLTTPAALELEQGYTA